MKTKHTYLLIVPPLSCSLFCSLLVLNSAQANDDELPPYQWEGTLQYGSNFSNESTGNTSTDNRDAFAELNLRLSRDLSPYHGWTGEALLAGRSNSQAGADNDVVLERARYEIWNGEGEIPWRVEAGDVFGYTTRRSFQSPIKGAIAEWQPRTEGDTTHSIQAFSGVRTPDYSTLFSSEGKDRFHYGVSYVGENSKVGAWTAAVVHNSEKETDTAAALEQTIASLGLNMPYKAGSHKGNVELEIDHLTGDVAEGSGRKNTSDQAFLAQVAGRTSSNWRYRIRYEDAGANYKPTAASVASDRTSYVASIGHRHKNGFDWQTELERVESEKSTTNPAELDLLKWRARMPRRAGSKLSSSVSGFVKEESNALNTVDRRSYSIRPQLDVQLPKKGWNASLSADYLNVDDKLPADADQKTLELGLGFSGPVSIAGTEALITPAFSVRLQDDANGKTKSYVPRIGMNINKNNHSFSGDFGLAIDDGSNGSGDSVNTELGLRYAHHKGPHQFSVGASHFSQDPNPGDDSDNLLFQLAYTYSFSGSHTPKVRKNNAPNTSTISPADNLITDSGQAGLRFAMFNIGGNFNDALAIVKRSNLGAGEGIQLGTSTVFDVFFFDDIQQRQQLSLRRIDDTLESVSLIFNLDDTGEPEDTWELYDRIQEELIVRYGLPARTDREDTEIEPGVGAAESVAQRRQVTEWDLPTGVLRFGMPTRTNGTRRFEIRYANSFGPLSDPFWSEENVD